MIKDDEIVVTFVSQNTARELELPDDVMVVTGLLDDDEVIVVPRQEFLSWLFERKEECTKQNRQFTLMNYSTTSAMIAKCASWNQRQNTYMT